MLKKIYIPILIILIFLVIVMFCSNFSKEEYDDDLAKVTSWNQLSDNYRFKYIEFINNKYYYGESILNNDVLDKLLSEKEINTYNEEFGEYKNNCKIYSLKEINENYIIAIQFNKDNNYYLYINLDYEINTLKDLIEIIDFKDNSNIKTITYNYFNEKNNKIETKKTTQDNIVKIDDLYNIILNKNLNSPTENSQQIIYNDYFKYEVIMDATLINLNTNILLKMTDTGYLEFNICGIRYSFYIGENNVDDFIDCFFEN